MSNPKPKDIIEFVKNWRSSPKHSYAENEILTEEQITNFVAELQEQVNLMDFSKTNGQTIIGYSNTTLHIGVHSRPALKQQGLYKVIV